MFRSQAAGLGGSRLSGGTQSMEMVPDASEVNGVEAVHGHVCGNSRGSLVSGPIQPN